MSVAADSVVRSAAGAGTAVAIGAVLAVASYSFGPGTTALVPLALGFVVLCALRPDLALVVTPLLAPLEHYQLPVAGIGGLSPIEGAMLSLAAGWAWRALTGRPVVFPSARDWPIFVLLLALLPGIALGAAAVVVAKLFVMWAAFYVAYLVVQELVPRQQALVLAAYAIGAALVGLEGISSYVSGGGAHILQGGATIYGRASGAVSDPNYFAALVLLSAVPALAIVVGGKGATRWLLVPALLLAATGVVLSFSRGGILGMSAGIVIVVVAWTRSRLIGLVLVFFLVAASATGLNPFANARVSEVVTERLTSVTTQSSDNHRFLLWGASVDIIQEHPLFGIGAEAFEAEASRRGLTERGQPLENVHNAYLNVATELGIFGAVGFLAWLVRIGRDLWATLRRRRDVTYPLAVGLTAAFVAYCIQALTVSQYRVEIIQATFFLFAGMASSLARRSEESPAT